MKSTEKIHLRGGWQSAQISRFALLHGIALPALVDCRPRCRHRKYRIPMKRPACGYSFVWFSERQTNSVLNHKVHAAGDHRKTVKIPLGINLQVRQELIEQAGFVRILIREG